MSYKNIIFKMNELIERFVPEHTVDSSNYLVLPTVRGEPIETITHGSSTGKAPAIDDDEHTPGFYVRRWGTSVAIGTMSIFVNTVIVDGSILLELESPDRWVPVAATMYTYLPGRETRLYTRQMPRDRYGSMEDVERHVVETIRATMPGTYAHGNTTVPVY